MTANWGGGGGSVIRILQRPYRDRVNFIVIRAKSSDSASPPSSRWGILTNLLSFLITMNN